MNVKKRESKREKKFASGADFCSRETESFRPFFFGPPLASFLYQNKLFYIKINCIVTPGNNGYQGTNKSPLLLADYVHCQ